MSKLFPFLFPLLLFSCISYNKFIYRAAEKPAKELERTTLFGGYSNLKEFKILNFYYETKAVDLGLRIRPDRIETFWVGPVFPIIPWVPGIVSYYYFPEENNKDDTILSLRIRPNISQRITVDPSKIMVKINNEILSPDMGSTLSHM